MPYGRSLRSLAVAFALLLPVLIGAEREPRPYVPSPGGASARPASAPPRPFPVQAYLDWNAALDGARERLERSEERATIEPVMKSQARESLAAVLPPGRYIFGDSCPLVYRPQDQSAARPYITLGISCLSALARPDHSVRLFRATADDQANAGLRLLNSLTREREFVGEVELARVQMTDSWMIFWRWERAQFHYRNAFLLRLSRKYPDLSEADLLQPELLKANTALLLGVLSAELQTTDDADSSQRDFEQIFPPGSAIEFQRSCPLILANPPAREAAAGFVRLGFLVSCIEGPLRQMRVVLADSSPELARLAVTAPGQRFLGRAVYRRIVARADQFWIEWDTIIGLEPL